MSIAKNFNKYLDILTKQANNQVLLFYTYIFNKQQNQINKQLKQFVQNAIKLIIQVDVKQQNARNGFIVLNYKNLQELFFILAQDIQKTGSGVIVSPKKELDQIAEYYSILVENRFHKLADIYYLAQNSNFLKAFVTKNKKAKRFRKELENYWVQLALFPVQSIQLLSFNIANTMSIIGAYNPKYWDDSVMEVYSYVFVLQAYILGLKYILSLKTLDCTFWLDYSHMIECGLDFAQHFAQNSITHKQFKTTLVYNKLVKTLNVLEQIYEQEQEKFKEFNFTQIT